MKKIIFFAFIILYFPYSVFAATVSLKDVASVRGETRAPNASVNYGSFFKKIADLTVVKDTVVISRDNSSIMLLNASKKNKGFGNKDIKSLSIQKKSNGANPLGVFADDKYIFIASEGWGLEVFDASNPSTPKSIGSYTVEGIEYRDIAVSQKYAFLVGDEFRIVDISNPTNIQSVSRYDLPTKGKKIVVSEKYAYIRDGANRLYVLDISNLQQPSLITTYKTEKAIESMQALKDVAYIVDDADMMQIVDFTNPLQPASRTPFKLKYGSKGKDMFIFENKIYISGVYKLWKDGRDTNLALQGSLEVIDISNDNQPSLDAGCDYWISIPYSSSTNHPYTRLVVSGNYIYASYYHELVVIEKSANSGMKMCQKGTRNNDIIAKSSIKPKVPAKSTRGTDYQSKVIKTSKGSYRAYLASFDLSNPKIKMLTMTASDTKHCGGMCNIKSLKSYVSENKALSGINGTQFRNLQPRDGPNAITGNHFEHSLFYKSNKKRMHNEEKIRINTAPMIVFASNQNWVFYASNLYFPGIPAFEKQYNTKVQAAFSSADTYGSLIFVYNSKITKEALAFADSFPANVKTTRSIIALKGSKVYFIIIPRANYSDAAYVTQSLGMEYAINLDGGGSSALYYKGQYKVGPGRNIPNAIVVAER